MGLFSGCITLQASEVHAPLDFVPVYFRGRETMQVTSKSSQNRLTFTQLKDLYYGGALLLVNLLHSVLEMRISTGWGRGEKNLDYLPSNNLRTNAFKKIIGSFYCT